MARTRAQISDSQQHNHAVQDASTQLDALLTCEAEDAAKEKLPAAAATADAAAYAADAADAAAAKVAARRRECLIAQCGSRLFPPAQLVGLSRATLRVAHSCVPNSQLQLIEGLDANSCPWDFDAAGPSVPASSS